MLFLRADLSQAESRIVYVLTHDPELLKIARSQPHEFDTHKFVGSCISGKPESEIVGQVRQAYKKIAHGSHYDEQPPRISDSLLKDGFVFTVDECMRGQQRYLRRFPAIQGVYQSNIRMRLIRDRRLTNSWGATIFFPYERFEPTLYRRGYAWIPQSEIGRLLNQRGFVPTDQYIIRHNLVSRLNMQVHDEILASTNPTEAWDLLRAINESLLVEREYEGEKLTIPIEYALERRYHDESVVFKKFPTQEEFMEKFNTLWEVRIR